MNAYISYWNPARIDWNNPGDKILNHAASQQYHKVQRGDRVYLLTTRNNAVYLLGSILVDAVVGQIEAANRLGCKPDELWEADYHLISAAGTAQPVQLIRCEEALRKVDFITGNSSAPMKEPITGQRFQSMRQITPASAVVLDELINAHRTNDLSV